MSGLINKIKMKANPVEGGFDPLPRAYAERYASGEWATFDPEPVDFLERRLGGLAGKRVLDLGGGPGQYAVEFARRGAKVVWHDVSGNYKAIAQAHAEARGLDIEFSLGYMEEAIKFRETPFDLIFNRICWLYCADDAEFAALFHALMAPGGHAYIDNFINPRKGPGRLRYLLNAVAWIKVGSPPPPFGRLERLFRRFPDLEVELLRVLAKNEIFLLTRKG